MSMIERIVLLIFLNLSKMLFNENLSNENKLYFKACGEVLFVRFLFVNYNELAETTATAVCIRDLDKLNFIWLSDFKLEQISSSDRTTTKSVEHIGRGQK